MFKTLMITCISSTVMGQAPDLSDDGTCAEDLDCYLYEDDQCATSITAESGLLLNAAIQEQLARHQAANIG